MMDHTPLNQPLKSTKPGISNCFINSMIGSQTIGLRIIDSFSTIISENKYKTLSIIHHESVHYFASIDLDESIVDDTEEKKPPLSAELCFFTGANPIHCFNSLRQGL